MVALGNVVIDAMVKNESAVELFPDADTRGPGFIAQGHGVVNKQVIHDGQGDLVLYDSFMPRKA